jgi:carbonic anhydrase
MDIFEMLGLAHGDAHIIRNAGGIVTDDVVRSLVVSQRLLGTREVLLVHHTDCGLQRLIGETLNDAIEAETGLRPAWAFEGFKDPYQNVRQSIRRLQVNPFIQYKEHIRGFVYRVEDGQLVEA